MLDQLTKQHSESIKRVFTDPRNCVNDAFFYATMTGQGELFDQFTAALGEMRFLAKEYESETGTPMFSKELGITFGERYAEAHQADDPRLARIAELAKIKLMIEVMPADINKAMVKNIETDGCPGSFGMEEVESMKSARVLN